MSAVLKPMRAEEMRLSYPFEAIPVPGEVFDITPAGQTPNAPRVCWLPKAPLACCYSAAPPC